MCEVLPKLKLHCVRNLGLGCGQVRATVESCDGGILADLNMHESAINVSFPWSLPYIHLILRKSCSRGSVSCLGVCWLFSETTAPPACGHR